MGITGRRGRPPVPGLDVKPGDQFGPWTVSKAGLRLWQTDKDPAGRRAARCVCVCGTGERTFKVSKLPGLAELGPNCPGHKRGAPRRGPGLKVKPGDRFGPWTVSRTGVALYRGYGAECACVCGEASRRLPVHMLPGLAALGPACQGHARGRPRADPDVKPGDRFGPWIVSRTGLRLSGGHAARCDCVCGEGSRTIRVTDLRRLAALGAACPGHKRGPKPRPRAAAAPHGHRTAAAPASYARRAAETSQPASAGRAAETSQPASAGRAAAAAQATPAGPAAHPRRPDPRRPGDRRVESPPRRSHPLRRHQAADRLYHLSASAENPPHYAGRRPGAPVQARLPRRHPGRCGCPCETGPGPRIAVDEREQAGRVRPGR